METGTQRLLGKKDGAIGWMIFNHPERRNALSIDMWEGIPRVLEAFEADPEVRVIVFKGAGDKAFISGADISQFGQHRDSKQANDTYNAHIAAATRAMTGLSKPSIAMEDRNQILCAQGEDFQEGVRAFLEKRDPVYGPKA